MRPMPPADLAVAGRGCGVTLYDRAVVEAAHHAAPIFANRGWTYSRNSEPHVPDYTELMDTVQHLVNAIRQVDVELDDDGFGEAWTSTGRWMVRRTIDAYTFDPSDDDISIMLVMGTIEDPKIPKDGTP
jgi:hypothetical protein